MCDVIDANKTMTAVKNNVSVVAFHVIQTMVEITIDRFKPPYWFLSFRILSHIDSHPKNKFRLKLSIKHKRFWIIHLLNWNQHFCKRFSFYFLVAIYVCLFLFFPQTKNWKNKQARESREKNCRQIQIIWWKKFYRHKKIKNEHTKFLCLIKTARRNKLLFHSMW